MDFYVVNIIRSDDYSYDRLKSAGNLKFPADPPHKIMKRHTVTKGKRNI